MGIIGGPTENRTQRESGANRLSAPAAGPYWCPALDSNQPLRAFNARQSPDLLTGQNGADAGNRNRFFGVAHRCLTFQQRPHWWGMGRVERLAAKGRRLQRRDGTARPYVHSPRRLQGSESNRLCLSARAYETRKRPVLVPASNRAGASYLTGCSSVHPRSSEYR